MAYSSRNCMVSREEAEKIRKKEIKRINNLLAVTKKATQFLKKHQHEIIEAINKRNQYVTEDVKEEEKL